MYLHGGTHGTWWLIHLKVPPFNGGTPLRRATSTRMCTQCLVYNVKLVHTPLNEWNHRRHTSDPQHHATHAAPLQRAIGVVFSKFLAIGPTIGFPSGLAKQPRQIDPFVFVPLFKMHWTRLVHQRGIKQHHSIPLVRDMNTTLALVNLVLVMFQMTVLQHLKFFGRINSVIVVHNHATR